jgi:hypothetical protein
VAGNDEQNRVRRFSFLDERLDLSASLWPQGRRVNSAMNAIPKIQHKSHFH